MLYTVAKENVIKNLLFRKRELLLIPFWAQNTLISYPMDKLTVVCSNPSPPLCPHCFPCLSFCSHVHAFGVWVFQCGTCGNFDELLCYCYIFFNYLSKFYNLECTRCQSIFATWETVSSKFHCCVLLFQNRMLMLKIQWNDEKLAYKRRKRGNRKKVRI